MRITSIQTEKIKKIAKKNHVLLCYLHGSRLHKEFRKDSDLDIAVLFEKDKIGYKNIVEFNSALQEIFPKYNIDLGVLNSAEPLYLYAVAKDNKLLYEKKRLGSVKFASYAVRRYADTEKFRQQEREFIRMFLKNFKIKKKGM